VNVGERQAGKRPVEIRADLVRVLRQDLVGPEPGEAYETEVLPQPPSTWYLAGFLVPSGAPEEQRFDETSQDEEFIAPQAARADDDPAPDRTAARRSYLPSSLGLSVLVPGDADEIECEVTWGDYRATDGEVRGTSKEEDRSPERSGTELWRRTPRLALVPLELPAAGSRPKTFKVPDSSGLELSVSVLPLADGDDGSAAGFAPAGTRVASVFLVNNRPPGSGRLKDQAFAFQAALRLRMAQPFVPRPNLRGRDSEDEDERIAALQYRDVWEYVVGHGVASRSSVVDGQCHEVASAWVPCAEVEKVVPHEVPDVELRMEVLAERQSADAIRADLQPLLTAYVDWIAEQRQTALPAPRHRETAEQLFGNAERVHQRVADGLAALDDADVLLAFRLANKTMARAQRRRNAREPRWRLFQLAFLLMNLRGLADPFHTDRETVDLLFFNTGMGKTEAYLGLAAFTLVLRRLRNPGLSSAGVSVLMRYTLRLLTLDQLGRAAALICALELERQADPQKLGPWPFEIGLWVGQGATPNRMGSKRKPDPEKRTARSKVNDFRLKERAPAPIPLEKCPWCGTKFTRNSFRLHPDPDEPEELRIQCRSRGCDFSRGRTLPIVAVDEPLYRRLPCFLIATVDKFAALPWTGECGVLFGKADRADSKGFYGPCEPGCGRPLEGPLRQPDLIIQDELHLISGPLGTIAGLYETAIDELCTRREGQQSIRPKIVASTATVRRAEAQIRALFCRPRVEIFPPAGPDVRDSFFVRTVPSTERDARLYVGVAAQGRSLKVVLLRAYLALLSAAQQAYEQHGGDKNEKNPADPYMTLVGYFNSLRELGGSRRIVEDEVASRLRSYGNRLRQDETDGPFSSRSIEDLPLELTSRENTAAVSDAKRRLELPFHEKERVDVALASNMISVGLDITRLGLMVILGQPKTTAEYIQSSSRVGRDDERPGLVVTLLNIHRPRDRSHFERFEAYHSSFYRGVEATSVTPFSPRALDRGLAGVVVGLARQAVPELTAPLDAIRLAEMRDRVEFIADALAERAEQHHAAEADEEPGALASSVRRAASEILDAWMRIARSQREVGMGLQYQEEASGAPRLLFDPLDPELEMKNADARRFKAHRSMRDVEPVVNLWLRSFERLGLVEDV
jgi:hypothetical protein